MNINTFYIVASLFSHLELHLLFLLIYTQHSSFDRLPERSWDGALKHMWTTAAGWCSWTCLSSETVDKTQWQQSFKWVKKDDKMIKMFLKLSMTYCQCEILTYLVTIDSPTILEHAVYIEHNWFYVFIFINYNDTAEMVYSTSFENSL